MWQHHRQLPVISRGPLQRRSKSPLGDTDTLPAPLAMGINADFSLILSDDPLTGQTPLLFYAMILRLLWVRPCHIHHPSFYKSNCLYFAAEQSAKIK